MGRAQAPDSAWETWTTTGWPRTARLPQAVSLAEISDISPTRKSSGSIDIPTTITLLPPGKPRTAWFSAARDNVDQGAKGWVQGSIQHRITACDSAPIRAGSFSIPSALWSTHSPQLFVELEGKGRLRTSSGGCDSARPPFSYFA